MRTMKPKALLFAVGVGAAGLAGCASTERVSPVPQEYLTDSAFNRHQADVTKSTELLEVQIDASASDLTRADKNKIAAFVSAYKSVGHGPLIMSMPQSVSNPQLAVQAIATARDIAYQSGVEYEEIAGAAHGAQQGSPLILAFQAYEATTEVCGSHASYDFADTSSNNNHALFGCSIRANIAMMLADPGDLLGQRPIGEGDGIRRSTVLNAYRLGESTGSERSDDESGAVSQAVE